MDTNTYIKKHNPINGSIDKSERQERVLHIAAPYATDTSNIKNNKILQKEIHLNLVYTRWLIQIQSTTNSEPQVYPLQKKTPGKTQEAS